MLSKWLPRQGAVPADGSPVVDWVASRPHLLLGSASIFRHPETYSRLSAPGVFRGMSPRLLPPQKASQASQGLLSHNARSLL